MKKCLLLLVAGLILLGLTAVASAQCPEDQNDLGLCDSLTAFVWDAGECDSFPCSVHLSLLVTHDSNTFYWQSEQKWVQDSIAAFVIPLKWTRTNPAACCSMPPYKNSTSFTETANSILRHFGGKRNRMLDLYEMGDGQEWNTIILDINNSSDPAYFWLSLVPSSSEDRRWWEGDEVLLATYTFTVFDTMSICVDTVFFIAGNLTFTRHDAVVYYPRHNMPCCMTVELQPFMRGDANGNGEVHIEDIIYLINYLFIGGSAPPTVRAGDANCDSVVDVADAIYLINYLFLDGSPPGCY
jgi:hypothetical protein